MTGNTAMRMGRIGFLAALLFAVPTAVAPFLTQAIAEEKFPDVIAAKIKPLGGDRFDFDVTISSPCDTPRRYADGFRVVGPKGEVYGERKLLHDHANEQPFTRDLHGVTIPAGLGTVIVEARDLSYGYGGRKLEVALPGR